MASPQVLCRPPKVETLRPEPWGFCLKISCNHYVEHHGLPRLLHVHLVDSISTYFLRLMFRDWEPWLYSGLGGVFSFAWASRMLGKTFSTEIHTQLSFDFCLFWDRMLLRYLDWPCLLGSLPGPDRPWNCNPLVFRPVLLDLVRLSFVEAVFSHCLNLEAHTCSWPMLSSIENDSAGGTTYRPVFPVVFPLLMTLSEPTVFFGLGDNFY